MFADDQDAADDEEYDFDYDDDDDDAMEEDAGDVENQYYKAKGRLTSPITVADDKLSRRTTPRLRSRRSGLSWMTSQNQANGELVRLYSQLTTRGFKALKQMTKTNYLFLHRPEEAFKTYRELLGYTKVGGPGPFSL